MFDYDQVARTFDGTIDSVPTPVIETVMDQFALSESEDPYTRLAGEFGIPEEVTRCVLAQPTLYEAALARKAGAFTLQFLTSVLPAVMNKAAEGGSGSIAAAKLVGEVIGALSGGKAGGKRKPEVPASLEERLKAIGSLSQANTNAG